MDEGEWCHTRSVTADATHELVRRLTAAMRDHDVLEPWLSESHWDDAYWSGEARAVVDLAQGNRDPAALHDYLVSVLTDRFGGIEAGNGLFRDDLDRRLGHIVQAIAL